MRPHCDGWCKETLITLIELVQDRRNHKHVLSAIVTAATCVTQNIWTDACQPVTSRPYETIDITRLREKTNTFFIAMSEGNNSPLNGPYGI